MYSGVFVIYGLGERGEWEWGQIFTFQKTYSRKTDKFLREWELLQNQRELFSYKPGKNKTKLRLELR